MHDLHAADKILTIVLEKANENKLFRVTKIVIELGRVIEHGQNINPENLKFNLQMLAKNTPAKSAEIIIKQTEINTWRLVEIEGE